MIPFDQVKKDLTDSEALILTVYGEGRGESIEGQVAIINVIMNRVKFNRASIKEVCFAPIQFSCWNHNDPNFPILVEMANKILYDSAYETKFDNAFRQIKFLCEGVLDRIFQDNTNGAKHYMTTSLYNSDKKPSWANNPKKTKVIGNHTFLVL